MFETGSDDDGEKWAGKRVESVLVDENVVGTVLVARWFGGEMLGPARFRWIETVAREAVGRFKRAEADGGEQRDGKKIKVDEDIEGKSGGLMRPEDVQKERRRLIAELAERDRNVSVLRALLSEKQAKLDGVASPMQNSPAKSFDYASMSLVRLQAMEKARDASVAFLLKELDKVDKMQQEEDEIVAAFKVIHDRQEKQTAENASNKEKEIINDAWNDMDEALKEKPK
jgi:uncharacterized protein UPF0029